MCETAAQAQTQLLLVIRRDPRLFGHRQGRWSLSALLESCPWLRLSTPSGMWHLLDRLAISYKRGRDYIHSPDCFYQQKRDLLELALLRAWYDPQRYVLLYEDELTYYRQPTLAREYECRGRCEPLARRSCRSNTARRVIGALDAVSGRLLYQQHGTLGLKQINGFYDMIAAAYPDAEQIYVVQDNWPVHFHPDILAHLQAQEFAYPVIVPSNWPQQPRAAVKRAELPIRLLPLPTYASWLNPIEKVWRWLKQDVLHLHRLSDQWHELQQRICAFLDHFSAPNTELLNYVGLLPP